MGQAGLTAVNLIVEDIEAKKANSIHLIENLENELDENQKALDSYCFDLMKKYKITNGQARKIFGYMKNAESLERIGDLCLNISSKYANLDCADECDDLINLGQYIKIIMTNAVVFLIENKIDLQGLKNDKGVINKYSESINTKAIEKMKEDGVKIPGILDYVIITKCFIKIYNLCINIVENTETYISEEIYDNNDKIE